MENMRVALIKEQDERLKAKLKMGTIKEAESSDEETISESSQIVDQFESHDIKYGEKFVPTSIHPVRELEE